MLRAPPANRAENDRHVNEGKNSKQRAQQSTAIRLFDQRAQQKIRNVQQPQNKCRSKPRVTATVNAPPGLGPDRSRNQNNRGEHQPNFRARYAEPVIFFLALPDVQKIAQKTDGKRSQPGPRAAYMKIKNPLQ